VAVVDIVDVGNKVFVQAKMEWLYAVCVRMVIKIDSSLVSTSTLTELERLQLLKDICE
jgi:hypothetical protein